MSLCSWLVENTGRKGSSAGLLPGSIEAQTHVQRTWTAALSTGKNLTFLFSASTRLDTTREGDRGGPIRGYHTMVPVSLTVFLNGLQWPLSVVSFSDCSASYQR